jgi:hypothetical protein
MMFGQKKNKSTNSCDNGNKQKNDKMKVEPPVAPPTFPLPHGAVGDHSPTIVNSTNYPVVVFLERGILYNAQVLHPGEAVCMTRKQTGGAGVLPYKVHAVIGDENSLPKMSDSIKNLVKVSVIPAAFIAGYLATAMSGGTLAGPSAGIASLVRGMVIKGVVIDSAALAAGSLMASRAKMITNVLIREQRNKFMTVSKQFLPGQRYLKVTGGMSEGPLQVEEVRKRKARSMQVTAIKAPMNSIDGVVQPTDPDVTDSSTGSTSEHMETWGEDPKPLPIENHVKVVQSVLETPTQTCNKRESWFSKKIPPKRATWASGDPKKSMANLVPATVL